MEADELLTLLEAADQLDYERHKPETLTRGREVRRLRDEAGMTWKEIAGRIGAAASTAMYLYGCEPNARSLSGPRRAVVATLALAGLRVSELCALDNQDIQLAKAKIYIRDAKTPAGVRTVDIRPRLLDELAPYRARLANPSMECPAFPSRTGSRRDRNNIRARVIAPVLNRANRLRADRDQAPIVARVTPHTFRRTYITVMLAAGFDVPYVQDQVGHGDPSVTLAIYAQVIHRADRDAVRTEMRELLGEDRPNGRAPLAGGPDLTGRWREHARREPGHTGLER